MERSLYRLRDKKKWRGGGQIKTVFIEHEPPLRIGISLWIAWLRHTHAYTYAYMYVYIACDIYCEINLPEALRTSCPRKFIINNHILIVYTRRIPLFFPLAFLHDSFFRIFENKSISTPCFQYRETTSPNATYLTNFFWRKKILNQRKLMKQASTKAYIRSFFMYTTCVIRASLLRVIYTISFLLASDISMFSASLFLSRYTFYFMFHRSKAQPRSSVSFN